MLGVLLLASICQGRNIVLILADDVSNKYINANLCPNITQMANQGVRYENAWATPKCGPTRVSIMTGKRGKIHGVVENGRNYKLSGAAFLPNKITDRTTGIVGKYNMPFPREESGFDRQVVWANTSRNTNLHALETGKGGTVAARFTNPAYTIDGILQNGYGKFGPNVFRDAAFDFMNESVANGEDFFLYYSMVLGHGMRNHKYPFGNNYNRNIREIDKNVGRVLNWARQNGNTTVIFATDNPTSGEGKSEISENGCKVALVIWGPDTPRKGKIRRRVQLRDLHQYILTGHLPPRAYNLTDFRNKSIVKKGNITGIGPMGSRNYKRIKTFKKGRPVDVSVRKRKELARIIGNGK